MRSIWWGAALLLLSGCVGNNSLYTASASERNIDKMSNLCLGMSESEVLDVMRHPYSHQSFQIGEDEYDVWFYITSPTVLGQTRMVPQNLTPLTFKNGELVGRGYNYYNWLVQQENARAKGNQKKQETPQEDTSLEKALQQSKTPATGQPAAPQQPEAVQPPQPIQPNSSPAGSPPPNAKPAQKPAAKPVSQSSTQEDNKDENQERPKNRRRERREDRRKEDQQKKSDQDKNQPPFNKEDQETIEEESEQNFDFW
ncbi:MAG: DUF3192 domain-containing protein [Verrucomicrobiota bacterium]|nr:DUF3192 domain-containing protein [Verrucomicrobiota bacterium]